MTHAPTHPIASRSNNLLPAPASDDLDDLDGLDDATLLARFEAVAIEPARFNHRVHVRLAFAVLDREGDLALAALRFRRALRAFAAAIGAAGRYHETLTWAYLVIVQVRMHETPCVTSLELLARHPDLLDHRGGALARYYDVASTVASPVARAVFVLPDR
jgi:hypothetical protein